MLFGPESELGEPQTHLEAQSDKVMIIVTNICFFISGALTFLLYCRPMAGYWDKSLKPDCAPITVLVRGGLANTGTFHGNRRALIERREF